MYISSTHLKIVLYALKQIYGWSVTIIKSIDPSELHIASLVQHGLGDSK